MGLGYKALSLLKSLASIPVNTDWVMCNLISFGYQYITLTVEQLHDLVGADNANRVFARYDCYGTQEKVLKFLPLSELKKRVFTAEVYNAHDVDNKKEVRLLFRRKGPKILRK